MWVWTEIATLLRCAIDIIITNSPCQALQVDWLPTPRDRTIHLMLLLMLHAESADALIECGQAMVHLHWVDPAGQPDLSDFASVGALQLKAFPQQYPFPLGKLKSNIYWSSRQLVNSLPHSKNLISSRKFHIKLILTAEYHCHASRVAQDGYIAYVLYAFLCRLLQDACSTRLHEQTKQSNSIPKSF